MAVSTNFQVSFGTSSTGTGVDAYLSAEIDSRADGLNAGKTSFVPGDTAYFLVFKSDNVSYSAPIPTAGTVTAGAAQTVEKTEDLQFSDADTATISIPTTALSSVQWLGTSLGSLTLTGTTVKASAKGVAIARVTYNVTADSYALASPATLDGLTDFSIMVYILGSVTGS